MLLSKFMLEYCERIVDSYYATIALTLLLWNLRSVRQDRMSIGNHRLAKTALSWLKPEPERYSIQITEYHLQMGYLVGRTPSNVFSDTQSYYQQV